jgi:hypothetical protein
VSLSMEANNQLKSRRKASSRLRLRTAGIAAGLLLAVFLPAAVLWQKSNDSNDAAIETKKPGTSTLPAAEDTDGAAVDKQSLSCPDGQLSYSNDSLGLQFCYPEAWGEVSVTDTKFDSSDTGSRFGLSFANKSQVNIGLVSDDWTTQAARDGVCSDPAVQTFPDTASFSLSWVSEDGSAVLSAERGLEVADGEYLIRERVDELLTNGVCVEGYRVLGAPAYRHAAVSYSAPFSGTVGTPQAHIDDPTALVPSADRADFAAVVKSIQKP